MTCATHLAPAARTPFAYVAIAVSLFALACTPESAPDPASDPGEAAPPNLVLLISIDTLRPDHLGLYGYEYFTSPILDAVALDGVVFEDASSTSPWTLPAHASMLTGLNPVDGHGVIDYASSLHHRVPTLASRFAEAGWQTAAVVSAIWLQQAKYGVTRGFEKFSYQQTAADRRSPSSMITEQARQWIEEAGGRPLFLFVHYFDVHSDYASEPRYENLFVTAYEGKANGTGLQLLHANFEDDYIQMCQKNFDESKCVFGGVAETVVNSRVEKVEFDEADVRHLRELYDAGVRQLDTELGRLIGFLDDKGLVDETLLLITSDHGEEFMDHGRVDHFFATYQESLRVPLIIRGPGIPAGVRIDAPVSLLDLKPTTSRMDSISRRCGRGGRKPDFAIATSTARQQAAIPWPMSSRACSQSSAPCGATDTSSSTTPSPTTTRSST
jgi:arylsulfatase A-like enzyme